ncbi:MAG: hypothetical protein ACOYNC_02115 [Bacteroidales bacterium]
MSANALHYTDTTSECLSNVLVISILLMLFGIYLLYFRRKKEGFLKFIRFFLLPFTFFSGFVVYFIGYQGGNTPYSLYSVLPDFLESVFSATRLFILGNDFVELEASFKHNPIFHAMFSLVAALAAFIFISVMVSVFLKDWLIKLKISNIDAEENHFFFSINHAAFALSADLLKNNSKRLVVFVNNMSGNENQHLYSRLPDTAYVVRNKSFFDNINLEKEEGLLHFFRHKKEPEHARDANDSIFHNLKIIEKKIGIAETHLYFLSDDEDWNVEHAKMILNKLKNRLINKPVRIHVATYTEIAEKHFAQYTRLSTTEITVVIHHYASIVSRQLILEHHPVDSMEIDSATATVTTDFNALVIGFGQIGTHVLRKLIEHGQFAGAEFHAMMIDKCMNVLRGRFEYLYPGLPANYELSFAEAEAGNTKFYNEIKKLIGKLNYIVISLGNDALNIQTALEILEMNDIRSNKLLKIFIKLEEESHWKETLEGYKGQIFIFGEASRVFTEENILKGTAERRGRIIHDVYNDLIYPNPDKQPFDAISRHEQLSNMSSAEHLYAKVRLLGYDNPDDISAKFTNNAGFNKSLSEIQKLNLSVGEHLRWNAFHFIHGWAKLPFEEINGTDKKTKYKNRKNTIHRKHACLVSWEKLTELSDLLGEDMQKPDVDSVENIYNFINYHPRNNAG